MSDFIGSVVEFVIATIVFAAICICVGSVIWVLGQGFGIPYVEFASACAWIGVAIPVAGRVLTMLARSGGWPRGGSGGSGGGAVPPWMG